MRVFNPGVQEHGWRSTNTIVEIVNDDMPFLVDTVTMEVNRHGLTLHLIVHPVIDASYMHVEVDRIVGAQAMEALAADLQRVLGDLRRQASPRHVPAKIVQVADIPLTKNGKVVELAVKAVVHGMPVGNTDALANPEALDLYKDLPELAD